jgi:hypothetical protein
LRFKIQLDNYIDDMRRKDSFQGISNLVDLLVKLDEINMHNVYDLVYLLLKLVFILSVTMTSVKRAFSTINFIKNRLRNRMNNNLLDDHLITFIECDVFLDVKKEDIINFLWPLDGICLIRIFL